MNVDPHLSIESQVLHISGWFLSLDREDRRRFFAMWLQNVVPQPDDGLAGAFEAAVAMHAPTPFEAVVRT